jgi:pimeloyl-ACP methyl ester carboxylesterase
VWDQRGAGKSYATLDPTDTFALDQLVADTAEVTEYLRDRFDEDRVFLVGQSWGSTLAVLAATERPELFEAVVGIGQMVSQRQTDLMFWEDTLAWAEETGRTALVGALRTNGPPPYERINDYEPVVAYEHDWNAYSTLDLGNEMPAILFVPEYTWMDRINAFRGFLDTNATLYPQLQQIDFRRDVTSLEVPFYMVLGEHEARGRAILAEEWFESLEAPTKESFVFEEAGHRAQFDRPAEFTAVMQQVLDATVGEG